MPNSTKDVEVIDINPLNTVELLMFKDVVGSGTGRALNSTLWGVAREDDDGKMRMITQSTDIHVVLEIAIKMREIWDGVRRVAIFSPKDRADV